MVQREDGSRPVLTEALADNEAQLQEMVKENPDLLPVDEFGMIGPLMVIGRETTLPSGYVDLVCLSRGGDLLLVEFKTGPQNSDFRHVLAQLLDYGSHLWQMSYEEFESTVANRYFSSSHCRDDRLQRKASLDEAARAIWLDLSEEETTLFHERLAQQLDSGGFHYIVVAQRFTPVLERTVEYLNATMSPARFYAVELVRFVADGISAFESRTVLKPEPRSTSSERETINEARFLAQVEDDDYREALQELLEVCRGLGLLLPWGTAGTSVRLQIPENQKLVSIAWLFPPGVSGWMGLRHLTLGYDIEQMTNVPSAAPALEEYVAKVSTLSGVERAKRDWAGGYHLAPEATVRHHRAIADILAELVQRVNEQESERPG